MAGPSVWGEHTLPTPGKNARNMLLVDIAVAAVAVAAALGVAAGSLGWLGSVTQPEKGGAAHA